MSKATLSVNDSDFEQEVTQSKEPVLVDFWAEWCGPCRVMGPILEEVAPTYQGRFKIAKLNVDDNSQTATRFGIMNIPTLIFFKDGNEIERVTGVLSKPELTKRIDRIMQS